MSKRQKELRELRVKIRRDALARNLSEVPSEFRIATENHIKYGSFWMHLGVDDRPNIGPLCGWCGQAFFKDSRVQT